MGSLECITRPAARVRAGHLCARDPDSLSAPEARPFGTSVGHSRCRSHAVGGLSVATVLCRHVVRRLGGVSGDAFGAQIEVATTTVLIVMAAGLTWR
jgi:hypothetical protein